MAIFNWNAQASGAIIAFNPLVDQFVIDDGNIYAANLDILGGFSPNVANVVFTYGDKTVTLLVDGRALTTTNVTFVNGSQVIVGDNTTGTASDDLNNVLTSTGDGDHLLGRGGNDRIVDTSGNDFLEGNAGTQDTVDYSGAAGGVTVDLAMGTATGAAGDDTLSGIEYVWGSSANDTITGDDRRNFLAGNGGDDVLDGGGQSVEVLGQDIRPGDFADYDAAPGPVTVDLSIVGPQDTVSAGNDTLINIESVRGSDGNDTLTGNDQNNFLRGGLGDDTLDGGAGNADFADYRNASGSVEVDLEAGTATGADGNDTLSNFEGIQGSDFSDTLIGDDNNNWFIGRDGDDEIEGAVGIDYVSFRYADGVVVNLTAGTATGEGNDTFTGIEGVEGSDFNDTLTGRNGEDDVLLGFAGSDTFFLTSGADEIDGGADFDTVRFDVTGIVYGGSTGVQVNLASGFADIETGVLGSDTLLNSIETVIGTAGDDVLTGGDEDHGRDSIGNNISERFIGGGGNDTITGGIAPNVVGLSEFSAIADYSPNTSLQSVTANLATGVALDGLGGTDTLANIDQLRGGSGNDTLIGGSQSRGSTGSFFEILRGNSGNDTLNGNNTNTGGTDSSSDRADYANNSSSQAVNVNLATGIALDGRGGTDTLIDIDQAYGGAGNDFFLGGAGNDAFDGGAGSDTLNGGDGTDEARYQQSGAAVVVNLSGAAVTANVVYANGETLAVTVASNQAYDGLDGFDTLINIENVRGSDFNDYIRGSDDVNMRQSFAGDAGNDYIDGGAGIDFASYATLALALGGITASIENGSGMVEDGTGGTDTLVNIEGLQGTNSSDILTGGEGDQWFRGRGGNDNMDGGAGSDWVSYSNDPTGVGVGLNDDGSGSAGDGWNGPGGLLGMGGSDALANIENIEGSDYADELVGNNLANEIRGRDGDDYLGGGAGNDILDGGAGNDEFEAGLGDDTLIGGEGTQDFANYSSFGPVTVDLAAGTASGAAGNDTLSGIEWVLGSGQNDTITGDEERNFIEGGLGDDILDGGGQSAIGLGRDTRPGDYVDYRNASQAVTVNLLDGAAIGGEGTDTLSNFESVRGSSGNDTLTGDGGMNFLRGMLGDDTLDGGADDDFADYREASGSVTVNLADHSSTGADGNDTLSNIEGIQGSMYNDILTGDGGDNFFQGRDGNDAIDGGAGFDFVSFRFADGVTASLTSGTASGEGNDTFSNVEGLEGSDFNDTLTGTNTNNDILRGYAGNDFMNVTQGNDTIDGGLGFDTIDFGQDGIAYGPATRVNVNLATGVADLNADLPGANTALVSIETVRGTAGNDILTGGDSAHATDVQGNRIGETFRGNSGNDLITGGAGMDFSATADYSNNSSTQHVVASLATGVVLDGRGGTDTLVNVDSLRGGSGNDMLVGGSFSRTGSGTFFEILRGNAGNDTLNGNNAGTGGGDSSTDRADYANNTATQGINVNLGTGVALDGLGGTDTLIDIEQVFGGAGNDQFTGAAGNDSFDGGVGNDILDGSAGTDTARFNQSTAAVIVNLSANAITVGTRTVASNRAWDGMGGTDTLISIESVRGSDFDDHIRGSDNVNTRQLFDGELGDDYIDGGAGIDFASYVSVTIAQGGINAFLENGAGFVNDRGGGEDTLVNIEGLNGTNSDDVLSGGAGGQWFRGRAGDDTINGGAGIDWASYGSDPFGVNVNLATGVAVDGFNGVGGFLALGGTDSLTNIENAEGSDYNDTLTGNAGANVFDGREGNDIINAAAGNDTLEGDLGNDTLDGGAGNDVLNGSDGVDRASYASAAAAVAVNLGVLSAQNTVGSGTDTLSAIENLTGSAFNDTLTGSTGNNALSGGNGNDTLIGGAGNDSLAGDAGTDAASYLNAAAGVTVNLSLLTAQNTVGAGTDTLGTIENLLGSALNDTLTGNTGANFLGGGAGIDVLSGGAGNDSLDGGAGNDTLDGGAGNDLLNGGLAGTDTASYASATAGVSVNLALATAQNTLGSGTDTLTAIDNVNGSAFVDVLIGNGGANTINGGGGIDELRGEGGNDTLVGGDGNDTLLGGAGNDILNGSTGVDTASYFTSTAGVTVSLLLPGAQNTLGAGTDTLTAIENLIGSQFVDHLTGNTGANLLRGFNGNDGLAGDAGNDTLDGGAGNDSLTGGTGNDILLGAQGVDLLMGMLGADRFDFDAISETGITAATRDIILDFVRAQADKIDLSTIDANGTLAGDQAFQFIGAAAFAGNATGKLRFDAVNHVVLGSTDADTAAEFSIQVNGLASMVATDFIL